ncbi:MAG: hypothetical protein M3Z25_11780 [Actinomycetota bacterium]|nr:hypothetical protein [Actinomycetota bacterium]
MPAAGVGAGRTRGQRGHHLGRSRGVFERAFAPKRLRRVYDEMIGNLGNLS